MNRQKYQQSPVRTKNAAKKYKENVVVPRASEMTSYRDKSLDMRYKNYSLRIAQSRYCTGTQSRYYTETIQNGTCSGEVNAFFLSALV